MKLVGFEIILQRFCNFHELYIDMHEDRRYCNSIDEFVSSFHIEFVVPIRIS